MECNNLSIYARDLISQLLDRGLEPSYQEVLSFITEHPDCDEIKYIIYALNYLKENSLMLELAIRNYELNRLTSFLLENQDGQTQVCSEYDQSTCFREDADGLIHFTRENYPKNYYELTAELITKIRIKDTTMPPQGKSKTYHERTYSSHNGQTYEHVRQFEIDDEGRILRVIHEEEIPQGDYTEHKKPTNLEYKQIYGGILGDILLNIESSEKADLDDLF